MPHTQTGGAAGGGSGVRRSGGGRGGAAHGRSGRQQRAPPAHAAACATQRAPSWHPGACHTHSRSANLTGPRRRRRRCAPPPAPARCCAAGGAAAAAAPPSCCPGGPLAPPTPRAGWRGWAAARWGCRAAWCPAPPPPASTSWSPAPPPRPPAAGPAHPLPPPRPRRPRRPARRPPPHPCPPPPPPAAAAPPAGGGTPRCCHRTAAARAPAWGGCARSAGVGGGDEHEGQALTVLHAQLRPAAPADCCAGPPRRPRPPLHRQPAHLELRLAAVPAARVAVNHLLGGAPRVAALVVRARVGAALDLLFPILAPVVPIVIGLALTPRPLRLQQWERGARGRPGAAVRRLRGSSVA